MSVKAELDLMEQSGQPRGRRFWAALAQLSLPLGAPLYLPLILFRWPGRRDPHVRRQAGAAFDFQVVAMAIYLGLGAVLVPLVHIYERDRGWIFLPWFALYAVWLIGVWVYGVRGAVRVARGHDPGYPDTWHILRDRDWPTPQPG